MRSRSVLALTAAMVAFSGYATAAMLASGPNYGGVTVRNGGFINCRLFNAGTATASVPVRQIFDNVGNLYTPSQDNCASLDALKSCQITAAIPGNLAFSCRVKWSGAGAILRGVSEVQDTGHNVLSTLPMQ